MISGRGRVHSGKGEPLDFLPGESLVVPPGEGLCIDVREAATEAPATFITVEMNPDTVQQVVDCVDESVFSALDAVSRPPPDEYVHFKHTPAIEQSLRTLASLCSDPSPYRDVLIDLNATALVVRMLETEARALLLARPDETAPSNGLGAAVQHVHDHLDRHVSVDELAEVACMSRSTFYRYFRDTLGVTPLQYVTLQRMERAQRLLRDPNQTITNVSYDLGFSSVSHFITTFKSHVGVTPKTYQEADVVDGPPASERGLVGDGRHGTNPSRGEPLASLPPFLRSQNRPAAAQPGANA